jgi:serine/threonine protein kinase
MGEIELLRGLNHPNIVKYIGSFKTRSHLYIIMEVGVDRRMVLIARCHTSHVFDIRTGHRALSLAAVLREVDTDAHLCTQFMENGALSNIIKPSRFGCFPEPLVAMYISQVRHPPRYV